MIERVITPENITLGVEALGLLSLAFAFSNKLKLQVKEEQNYKCDNCGKDFKYLQCHHRIPQCYSGNDTRENCIALCSNCHVIADNKAIVEGIIYPNIPISEAPTNLFKNKNVREKVLKKFINKKET